MIGLGLLIVWAGYTGFSYGNAARKGATVTFSDMVLPSHRDYALQTIAHATTKQTKGGGTNPLLLFGTGFAGPIAKVDAGGVAVGANALKTFANGLSGALKAIGL